MPTKKRKPRRTTPADKAAIRRAAQIVIEKTLRGEYGEAVRKRFIAYRESRDD